MHWSADGRREGGEGGGGANAEGEPGSRANLMAGVVMSHACSKVGFLFIMQDGKWLL